MTASSDDIKRELQERSQLFAGLDDIAGDIATIAQRMTECLRAGGTVYACGNGGSATQAQHFAAELVGRFKKDRRALRAFALNDNPAVMTSLANDYDYNDIFAHQLAGIARSGDFLLALSTSGTSENVVRACKAAREAGAFVAGLTGRSGGAVADHSDATARVPDDDTARIQEVHITIIHLVCQHVEAALFADAS